MSLQAAAGPESESPDVRDAFERVTDAGQRLAADRMALLALEVRERVSRAAAGAAFAAAGGALAALGWIALMAALVVALEPVWPLAVRLAAVGGGHLVAGAVLFAVGARRAEADGDDGGR